MTQGVPTPIDLTSCESEPIRIPGCIQPHGVLLALDPATHLIEQISSNCIELLGFKPEELIGSSPATIFGERQFQKATESLRAPPNELGVTTLFVGPNAEAMECVMSRYRNTLLLELQPLSGAHSLDLLDISLSLQAPLARMERTSNVDELVYVVAKEIRAISGFDRVMVYRFDEDWHGVVLAEDVSDQLPVKYLGLHFPASDIPPQARELYLLNTLRLIADTHYVAVAVVPAESPRLGMPLDLSHSDLRSVSPVHLEYLRNIGVRATLTISIIVRGRLWGLVACHHNSPRRLNHAVRSTCNFFAQMLALKLTSRIDHTMLAERLSAGERIVKFVAELESTHSLLDALRCNWEKLLPIFDGDALVVKSSDGVGVYGTSIAIEQLQPTMALLRQAERDGVASCSSLRSIDDTAKNFAAEVSGAL